VLKLWTSNNLNYLSWRLAGEMSARPLETPFKKEFIVVQTRGMERWLTLELAKYRGIFANVQFIFPNGLVTEILQPLACREREETPFDVENLVWAVINVLTGEFITTGEAKVIRRYIMDDPGLQTDVTGESHAQKSVDLRLYQLACRISDILDQYVVYRPDLIKTWENHQCRYSDSDDEPWQKSLWNRLVEQNGKTHRLAVTESLFLNIHQLENEFIHSIAERIWVFGLSTLSPFHLDVLERLSQHLDVGIFLLSPCREYWGDIKKKREIIRIRKKIQEDDFSMNELHLWEGNRLLASLGDMGKQCFAALFEIETLQHDDWYDKPGRRTLLSNIQEDMLELINRGEKGGSNLENRLPVDPSDESIRIIGCHSPMREVEILHDHLLHFFEQEETVKPGDILVMTPAIDSYAPYIDAVFGSVEEDIRIPYAIAGRSIQAENSMVDAFFQLLDLAGSRFEAPTVMGLLDSEPVRQKFCFTKTDIQLVRHWVQDTGIRWGIDGESKKRFHLPPYAENTWTAGLRRMLLGYAMAGENRIMMDNILPYDHIEGENAHLLGKFFGFMTDLFQIVASLEEDKTPADWADVLGSVLDRMFLQDDQWDWEINALREVIYGMKHRQEISGFKSDMNLATIKYYLRDHVSNNSYGFGFMTGRVTFSSMIPMRGIPFRIICLLGLNEVDFPRMDQRCGFDLMSLHPRPLDRSVRDSDRYLFLETLLSAKSRFYVSYVSRNIRDNSVMLPSIVVTELLDAFCQGYFLKGDETSNRKDQDRNLRKHIITEHPLHSFSPRYFDDRESPTLFSFSTENARAARELARGERELQWIDGDVLDEPDDEFLEVSLKDLVRFFRNPAEYLVRHRLKAVFPLREEQLQPKEYFEMDGLQKYKIREELLESGVDPMDEKTFYSILNAQGRLPHGVPGEVRFYEIKDEVDGLARKIEKLSGGDDPLEALPVDTQIIADEKKFHLTGVIEDIYPRARIIAYPGKGTKAKDVLSSWIYHLALNLEGGNGYPRESIFISADKKQFRFRLVEKPGEILQSLLRIYWRGLKGWLPFTPEVSRSYVADRYDKKDEQTAFENAERKWTKTDFNYERENIFFRMCMERTGLFEGNERTQEEFKTLAEAVFDPAIDHGGPKR